MKRKIIPILGLIILIGLVYWQFFLKGKIPVPADLMTGVYYPWLDYKWGYPVGVPVVNPSISDIFSQFYPWKYLVVELFKKGIIPLWNQYSFSGTPILENYHTGVFFPFNIFLFLPKHIGWGIYIFGQTLFAAIGMFLFLKHYIKNIFIKFSGALIFSLSGLMTTWVEFGTGVWAAAMLPWIFYFINCFIEKRKFKNLFFLSLSYGSLILAGHAQLTLYSTLLICIYLIYLLITKKILIKDTIIIGLFIILGIGISAIELIPTYNQVSISVRSYEKSYIKELNNGLTPWYDLIRLYIPDFFGNPSTYNYWGDISYYENSPFLATLSLPFLLVFFLKRFRKKQTSFWFIVFCSTIFLATANPLTSFFYNLKLPFLTYSSASRIFFLSSFCAGILVPIGIELLFKNKHYRRAVIFSSIFLILITLFALLKLKLESINFNISFRNSVIPLGLLSILIILLIFNVKRKIVLVLLMFLIFFDLSRYFNKFNPFVDKKIIFPDTPITQYLQNQNGLFRIGRLNREVMTPNSWIPYHLSSVEGYDPLAQTNYSRFFNRTNNGSYNNDVGRFSEMYENIDFKFLNALNVKYLLSVENDKQKISPAIKLNNLKEVFRDKSTVIYENTNSKERFYFVSKVTTVSNISEMAKIIDKKDFDPTKNALIIEGNTSQTDFNIGDITVDSYQANLIELTTVNHKNGFLIIADTYNSGWKAYIDNQPTKIFEVNGALRGIQVPQGQHKIKMIYWPKSFDIGLKISIICLSILLISNFYFLYKKIW